MKSCSSSASIEHFLNANDDLSDDDISLEKCADKQATILHKGKQIEVFIQTWAKNHPKDTSYRLLCILFDLFKSEVSSNLSLRKVLMNYRTNVELSEEYERQLTRLFTAVKRYDPKIQSLTDILDFFKKKISIKIPEELINQVSDAKNEFQQLSLEVEDKQKQFEKMKNSFDKKRDESSKKIECKERQLEESKKEEEKLKEKLKTLQTENIGLKEKEDELKREEDPQKLKETIEIIDGKLGELQTKIHFVNKNYQRKVGQLRTKIGQYDACVTDLCSDKSALESELDRIHQDIDVLVNPLSNCKDDTKSPHLARIRLNDLKIEYTQLQKKQHQDIEEIEILEQNVDALETKLNSLNNKMGRGMNELKNLEREYNEKESILKEMEEKRNSMKEIALKKREIEEVKRHADAENIRLKQELESAKAKARQCAIDHNLLSKTIESLQIKKNEYIKLQNDTKLTEEETRQFDIVIDSYRNIRESLSLPNNSSPAQVTNSVLAQMP